MTDDATPQPITEEPAPVELPAALSHLHSDPDNPRQISDMALSGLAASVSRFGDLSSVTFNTRTQQLVCGHQRVRTLTDKSGNLPIETVDDAHGVIRTPDGNAFNVRFVDWSPAVQHAANVAANNTLTAGTFTDDLGDYLNAHIDDINIELGAGILADLRIDDLLVDLELETPAEPEAIEDTPAQTDRAAELQEKWQTAAGQLWLITGKSGLTHRLLCGDCSKLDEVNELFDGVSINVAFTSPPYASQRKYDEKSAFKPIPPDKFVEWFEPIQRNVMKNLADDGSWFVNIKEHSEDGQRSLYVKDLTIAHVRNWNWRFADEFCWIRQGIPGCAESMKRFKGAWESVFWFAKGEPKFRPKSVMHESSGAFSYKDQVGAGKKIGAGNQGVGGAANSPVGHGSGMAYPSNVLDMKQKADAIGHAAAFPVCLPSFFIKAYSDEGDHVYDPFIGSGTTIAAGEGLGRKVFGMEISAAYVAVTLQRMTDAGCTCRLEAAPIG